MGSFSFSALDTSPQGLIRSQFTWVLVLPLFGVLYNMLLFSCLSLHSVHWGISVHLAQCFILSSKAPTKPAYSSVYCREFLCVVICLFIDKTSCSPGWLELSLPFSSLQCFLPANVPHALCFKTLKVLSINPLIIWLLCRSLHVGQFGMNFSEHGLYFSISLYLS